MKFYVPFFNHQGYPARWQRWMICTIRYYSCNRLLHYIWILLILAVPFNTLLLSIVGCQILSAVGFVLILTGIVSSAFASQLWHLIVGFSVVGGELTKHVYSCYPVICEPRYIFFFCISTYELYTVALEHSNVCQNVYVRNFIYISGLGTSMNFISSIGIIPHYFEKRKLAAYTAPGVGSGIAMVSFSYILTSLLEVHGYKMTILYLSPIFLLAASAPIVFKPQISSKKPASVVAALKTFITPCKLFVTPFYLLNAYFWNGGHVSIMVLLFGYIVDQSQVSVAAFTYSLMGAGFLTGTLVLAVYLMKFSLNHFLLQICREVYGDAPL